MMDYRGNGKIKCKVLFLKLVADTRPTNFYVGSAVHIEHQGFPLNLVHRFRKIPQNSQYRQLYWILAQPGFLGI